MNLFFIVIITQLFLGTNLLTVDLSQLLEAEPTIRKDLYDGPYIFDKGDSLLLQWVAAGVGYDTLIAKSEATEFKVDALPTVNLRDLEIPSPPPPIHQDINKVVALSDVHGQYDVMITLLRNQGVIDVDGNWSFGNNHLVIVGDNFDRGPKVLDILWFLFELQKQAASANGMVHVLLGNHEIMVLNGDLRYLNKKYYYTSAAFKTRYDQFFARGSILGDWIASHSAMVSINNKLFVHGGMSPLIVQMGFSIKEINDLFRNELIRQDQTSIVEDDVLANLYMENGPLWYRGYFDRNAVNKDSLEDILKHFGVDAIVVGHTSQKEIRSLYDSRIFVVDCSIKIGKTGQVLILENGEFSIGEYDGTVSPVKPIKYPSLFGHIYDLVGMPTIQIDTDVKRLINKSSKEEYQPAIMEIADVKAVRSLSFTGEVRARGNTRKKVCRIPPVKYNIPKNELIKYGLDTIDKLKFVFPCKGRTSDIKYNDREFFLYDLYNLIDTNAMKAKRVQFVLSQNGKEKYNFTGFVVEDEESYAHRKEARIVESGIVKAATIHRESFLKMAFFQYMIANTDWTVKNKHNLEIVKVPEIDRVIGIPYDFDYSGFVGQSYAVPHESLPIESVQERYFFNYKITEGEFYAMVTFYQSMENAFYELCDQASYMEEKERAYCKRYLKGFFDLLKHPDRLKADIIRS